MDKYEAKELVNDFIDKAKGYVDEAEETIQSKIEERRNSSEMVMSRVINELENKGELAEELEKEVIYMFKRSFILCSRRSIGNELAFKVAEKCIKKNVKEHISFESFFTAIPQSEALKIAKAMKEFMPMGCINITCDNIYIFPYICIVLRFYLLFIYLSLSLIIVIITIIHSLFIYLFIIS